MALVDKNRRIGNLGVSKVLARLSGHCLLRPVAAETDVGVDLFCETVEQHTPFLHFWLQVKTGSQCRVSKSGDYASCSFKAKHISYWARQPVPVFAALVPKPETENSKIYIICVTDQLLREEVTDRKTRTLRSDFSIDPGSTEEDICYLLETRVPRSTALMSCKAGVVAALPYLYPQNSDWVPLAPVATYEHEILRQIHSTAAFSILFLDILKDLAGERHEAFRNILAGVLAQFGNNHTWVSYAAQAYCKHIDAEYETAVEFYDKAISDIEDDPDLEDCLYCQQRLKKLKYQRYLAMEKAPYIPGGRL